MYRNYFLFLLYILFFCGWLHAEEKKDNWNNFKSHEAIYNLKLGDITNSSKIHNASGQMHITIKAVCDGWIINQNTTLDITDKNGFQRRNVFRYSIWESNSHDMLRFMSKVIIDGEELASYEGESYIKNGVGKIIYTRPHNKVINIPLDTLYPMKHFFISLDKNKTGELFNYIVFTGEDDKALNNVSTFTMDNLYEGVSYKIIRSANYNYNNNLLKPENEIEILVNPKTGVVQKVLFDYFDYEIIGVLKYVIYYNKPEC